MKKKAKPPIRPPAMHGTWQQIEQWMRTGIELMQKAAATSNRKPRARPPIVRMAKILEKLEDYRALNATTLAGEFEISTKTAHRDLTYMRDQLGIPIVFNPGRKSYQLEPGGKWYLKREAVEVILRALPDQPYDEPPDVDEIVPDNLDRIADDEMLFDTGDIDDDDVAERLELGLLVKG